MGGEPQRLRRQLECLVGFFLLPPCLYLLRHRLAFRVVPLTLSLAVGAGLHLARARDFERRRLWSAAGLGGHLRGILLCFLPSGLLLGLLTAVFLPHQFVTFPLQAPWRWALVMLLYPPLAAYPQELVFRAFFFHRYRSLFPGDASLVVLNGLGFGLAHLFFGNWVAVLLSWLGGMLFAFRYLRTGLLLAASLEHGLWGDLVFTLGIGWYLYSGSIR